jgi:hypothetical protein
MWLLIIVLLLAVGTITGADPVAAPAWPGTADTPGSPERAPRPGWAPAGEYVDPLGRFVIVPPAGWSPMNDPTRASRVQFAESTAEDQRSPAIMEIDLMADLSPHPVPIADRAGVLARYADIKLEDIKLEYDFVGALSATSTVLPDVADGAPARLITVRLHDRSLQVLVAFDPNGLDCYQLRAERPHTASPALDPILLESLRSFRVLE